MQVKYRAFKQAILTNKASIHPLFEFDINGSNLAYLNIKGLTNQQVSEKIKALKIGGYQYTLGGYLENRRVYDGGHFAKEKEPRTIHLGVDVSAPAETPIKTPLDAVIYDLDYKPYPYDYGGVIMLQHELENITFYTLYGHLSKQSINSKKKGQHLQAGEPFAQLGKHEENGFWNPHLHFQIVLDDFGKGTDFIGVCSKQQLEFYKLVCPNPNYMLKSILLQNNEPF